MPAVAAAVRPQQDRPREVLPTGVEHGHQVLVDPHPLLLAGVAPDEDRRNGGEENRPADDPRRPTCSDRPTICMTTSTGMTAMTSLMPRRSLTAREKMLVRSPSQGDEEPGQRVDQIPIPFRG